MKGKLIPKIAMIVSFWEKTAFDWDSWILLILFDCSFFLCNCLRLLDIGTKTYQLTYLDMANPADTSTWPRAQTLYPCRTWASSRTEPGGSSRISPSRSPRPLRSIPIWAWWDRVEHRWWRNRAHGTLAIRWHTVKWCYSWDKYMRNTPIILHRHRSMFLFRTLIKLENMFYMNIDSTFW